MSTLALLEAEIPYTIYVTGKHSVDGIFCVAVVAAADSAVNPLGLTRNPLINGLIQHTFKIFLFVEKFTVIP